ncbi:MAG: YbfB/YjiJ family MFS transporter [Trueperaceae bacterium]|nr:YbfB/YjiJ family MFS transporter [Trueperaceae bacterium]
MTGRGVMEGRVARALLLSLGPAVSLGLARFAYALILPAMRDDLGWSYAEAGAMNTANALGYLAGALLSAPLAMRLGNRRIFWVAMLITTLGLLISGLTPNYLLLLTFRTLVGFSGAVTFISGAALASRLAVGAAGGSFIVGLYFGGVGLGIVTSGVGLPLLLERGTDTWPLAWLVLGGLGLVATFVGRHTALSLPELERRPQGSRSGAFETTLWLWPAALAYFLFGLGYITYMTFVIAFLRDQGTGTAQVSFFWLVLGLSTALSTFVWGRALDKMRSGYALALILLLNAVGAGIPLLSTTLAGLLASAVLFGSSFLSVVSAVTTIVRNTLPQHAWTGSIAFFTVLFSVGQTLGPLLSGALADRSGDLRSGFLLSALLLLVGGGVALLQRDTSDTVSST